ncbi:MAG TPA: hypothetical protein VF541_10585 [Longimicrobium sp.]
MSQWLSAMVRHTSSTVRSRSACGSAESARAGGVPEGAPAGAPSWYSKTESGKVTLRWIHCTRRVVVPLGWCWMVVNGSRTPSTSR